MKVEMKGKNKLDPVPELWRSYSMYWRLADMTFDVVCASRCLARISQQPCLHINTASAASRITAAYATCLYAVRQVT